MKFKSLTNVRGARIIQGGVNAPSPAPLNTALIKVCLLDVLVGTRGFLSPSKYYSFLMD